MFVRVYIRASRGLAGQSPQAYGNMAKTRVDRVKAGRGNR
jgi:hypothetical protein